MLPVEQQDVLATKPSGVVVAAVDPSGPAAQAGIQKDDVLLKVNGQEIDSSAYLVNYVGFQAPNSKVKINLQRAGQMLETEVIVAERMDKPQLDPRQQYIPLPR